MKKNNMVLGIILLALGVVALLNNIGLINFSFSVWRLWPLVLLIPGLSFELSYFNKDGDVGLLMPGGILTTFGTIFMICSIFGWQHMSFLWPWFLGGVGIGFYQMYIFGDRDRAIFWLGFSFTTFAVVASTLSLLSLKGSFVFPALLIVIGGILLYQSRKDKDDEDPLFSVEFDDKE